MFHEFYLFCVLYKLFGMNNNHNSNNKTIKGPQMRGQKYWPFKKETTIG